MTSYVWEAYDVLQCERAGRWRDFSSIRTEADARRAVQLVECGEWQGEPLPFRIVRSGRKHVVLSK